MSSKEKELQKKIRSAYQEAGPYLSIAYAFLGAIVIFGYGGHITDEYFNTSPLFLLVGLFTALAASFYYMYLILRNLENKDKNDIKN